MNFKNWFQLVMLSWKILDISALIFKLYHYDWKHPICCGSVSRTPFIVRERAHGSWGWMLQPFTNGMLFLHRAFPYNNGCTCIYSMVLWHRQHIYLSTKKHDHLLLGFHTPHTGGRLGLSTAGWLTAAGNINNNISNNVELSSNLYARYSEELPP